ncbi:MAG: zinc ABC transporter substrate-binding protein [Bacteroidetes bacterium]|nr:zinc ABC transporter substrate-binding protein [Bacteroidota bacterium]
MNSPVINGSVRKIVCIIALVSIFQAGNAQKPDVVVTTTFLADISRNIAGEHANIISLMPLGADPHIYDPVPQDAKNIADADLIIKNGLTLEGWLNKLIENSGSNALIVISTEGIEAISNPSHVNSFDPHAWMTASNGMIYARNIKNALVTIDPAHRTDYEKNFQEYLLKLEELDAYILEKIKEIEPDKRIIVTSHDAFRYYGNRYGLEVESILGTSTDADVQIRDIDNLINVIVDHELPAIFMESTINPKLMQQIARDLGIIIGGKLFADSLGDEESGADTYLNMLRQNTDELVRGLTDQSEGLVFEFSNVTFLFVILILFGIIFVVVAYKIRPGKDLKVQPGSFEIKIERLTASYGKKTVLSNINLIIRPGKIVGIIGPNGSGKSTLFKAILGLIPIDSGKIEINNAPIDHYRKYMTYIPQKEEIDWDFPATVLDVVLMGRYPHKKTFDRLDAKDKKLAYNAMEQVDILSLKDRQIGELSGGQQQRVFLARALCQEAEVYLLDEPLVGVDITTEEKLMEILRGLAEKGKTLLIVHHDLSKVKDYFHDLIMLNQRLIAAGPTSNIFTEENIKNTYQAKLPILQESDKYVHSE